MLAAHLIPFLKKQHSSSSRDFSLAIQALCEAMQEGSCCIEIPDNHSWQESLDLDQAGSVVGRPADRAPLIFADGRLYFERYYRYEDTVFQCLNQRSRVTPTPLKESDLKLIEQCFGPSQDYHQASAALCAMSRQLTVITGGPGTGKTTTVLQILRLLSEQQVFDDPNQVAILAPTGKAADRLRQSIRAGIQRLELDASQFPDQTSTIHRALGYRPNQIEFRHNAENPLLAKVVIVDESSMIDLPLMAKLLQAVSPEAKLILLGDKNQLTSVEVGSVLADLTAAAHLQSHPIADCVITLQKSYRTKGAIHAVCEAVKLGDSAQAFESIKQSDPNLTGHVQLTPLPKSLINQLRPLVEQHWIPVLQSEASPEEKLRQIDRFRILCPAHHGPYGINAVNRAVEHLLQIHGIDTNTPWYHGRSIIIQKNSKDLNLFNGDTGLCLIDKNTNNETDTLQAKVHFQGSENELQISPAILPECKTAWALTIHRTQGSEYDHVLVILDDTQENGHGTSRELLYTALSRAKISATLWASNGSLETAIHTSVKRASGLSERFHPNAPDPSQDVSSEDHLF